MPTTSFLTLRALRRGHIDSDVVVVRDGAQALDYCFGTVQYDLPDLILLDLKLPKVDGLTVLRRLRSDARTRLLPVVILTSSLMRSETSSAAMILGPIVTSASQLTFNSSRRPSGTWGCIG